MIPLRDSAPSDRFSLATYVLIALNLVVFYLEFQASNIESLIQRYALIPNELSLSSLESWVPLFTSQFLHGGLVHLLSNIWFLKIFGDSVESVMGGLNFFVFYLASGVAAGLVQFAVEPSSSIPVLGASGAVAGILGAYFVFFPRHRIETLIPVWGFWQIVELPASFMLFYWFIIQLLSGIASVGLAYSGGGIAFFAHAGGFVFGFLLSKMLGPKFSRKRLKT